MHLYFDQNNKLVHNPLNEVMVGSWEPTDPDVISLIARMSDDPPIGLKSLINKTIIDLKSSGNWGIHDILYFFNLHTAQASSLNWCNTLYNASLVNSPTFTPKIGITTISATNSYITTNYKPATNKTNFDQNSASVGIWIRNSNSANNSYFWGDYTFFRLMCRTNDALLYMIESSGGAMTPTINGLIDTFQISTRAPSTNVRSFRNKISQANRNTTASALQTTTLTIGKGFGTADATFKQFNVSSFMTQQQCDDFYDILKYFNDNVGQTF